MRSGDFANASRVLLNLSELHARRAERMTETGEGSECALMTEAQYLLWLKAIDCCEEASALSENTLGRREAAFAHLRVGVHLSVRIPTQGSLACSKRGDAISELADRHLGKALHAF